MIKKAKALGLVEIIIKPSFENHLSLEKMLTDRFGLKHVLVAYSESSGIQEEFDSVCNMGASYLSSMLDNHSVLSVSRGKTVSTVIQNLNPRRTYPDMKIVQFTGSLENTSNPGADETYTMQRIATLYGCEFKPLFLPYLMDDEESQRLIMKRGATAEIFRHHQDVNTFISGVDTLLFWTDYISEQNVAFLMKKGAVGCLWGYFFDINGNIIETPLYDRMIIPKRSIFQTVDTRICIANDRFKIRAILGALRGGMCNVLITNSKIARHLLSLDETSRSGSDS